MADLQSKIGDGMSKIQGSIDQGKKKLKTVQEISGLEKDVNELIEKRALIIYQIGESSYASFRTDKKFTFDPELIESLKQMDSDIYVKRKMIADKKQQHQTVQHCSNCKEAVNDDDKFCGSCGQPVVKNEIHTFEMKECVSCSIEIPRTAHYCCGCGTRQLAEVH